VNELLLTAIRFGFLGLLWVFIAAALATLRRDLKGQSVPANARVARALDSRSERKQRGGKAQPSGIEILDGPLAGATMAFSGADIVIGRAPDCTIVLTDDYVSSKHTRIRKVDDVWFVEDLGSTNGTWVNRSRLTAATPLSIGMVVNIGRTPVKVTG
jgi:pSer/pThr/pTyr-binding forkhead associated (FHA) protein